SGRGPWSSPPTSPRPTGPTSSVICGVCRPLRQPRSADREQLTTNEIAAGGVLIAEFLRTRPPPARHRSGARSSARPRSPARVGGNARSRPRNPLDGLRWELRRWGLNLRPPGSGFFHFFPFFLHFYRTGRGPAAPWPPASLPRP